MFTCTQKLNQKERLSTAYPPLIHPIESTLTQPNLPLKGRDKSTRLSGKALHPFNGSD